MLLPRPDGPSNARMAPFDTVKSISLRTNGVEKACDRFFIEIINVLPTAIAGDKISTLSFIEERAYCINYYSLCDLIVSRDAARRMRQIYDNFMNG